MFLGAAFGLWNNVSTLFNAFYMAEQGREAFSSLMLFFLFFPGLVTSVGLIIVHCLAGKEANKVSQQGGNPTGKFSLVDEYGRMKPVTVMVTSLTLLLFYPLVPIAL